MSTTRAPDDEVQVYKPHRAGLPPLNDRGYRVIRPWLPWRVARSTVLPTLDLSQMNEVVVGDPHPVPLGWHIARMVPHPRGEPLARPLGLRRRDGAYRSGGWGEDGDTAPHDHSGQRPVRRFRARASWASADSWLPDTGGDVRTGCRVRHGRQG